MPSQFFNNAAGLFILAMKQGFCWAFWNAQSTFDRNKRI